jgi:hypothetical protein
VHHGRHFGRVVHALCTVNTLLNNGILRMGELADRAEDTFTREYVMWSILIFVIDSPSLARERREHQVFRTLLQMIPGMEDRLMEGSEEDIVHIAELVCNSGASCVHFQTNRLQIQKGASGARSDDTKSLKGAVLDWITPRGQPLNPPLTRNVKSDRGFHHERTGALLCPTGLDWANTE